MSPEEQEVVEKQVAAAIEKLREDLPSQFILLYHKGNDDTAQAIMACSLNAGKALLEFGMHQLVSGYTQQHGGPPPAEEAANEAPAA